MSHQNPQPEQPARIFGVVKVHAECAVGKCHEPTVAAAPIQIPDDTGVWWLCEKHADAMPWFEGIRGRRAAPVIYNLSSTCRINSFGADLPPCGGAADYLAIAGRLDDNGSLQLETVSVCERHVNELPTY